MAEGDVGFVRPVPHGEKWVCILRMTNVSDKCPFRERGGSGRVCGSPPESPLSKLVGVLMSPRMRCACLHEFMLTAGSERKEEILMHSVSQDSVSQYCGQAQQRSLSLCLFFDRGRNNDRIKRVGCETNSLHSFLPALIFIFVRTGLSSHESQGTLGKVLQMWASPESEPVCLCVCLCVFLFLMSSCSCPCLSVSVCLCPPLSLSVCLCLGLCLCLFLFGVCVTC